MSNRGRPRKVPDKNAGISEPKRTAGTQKSPTTEERGAEEHKGRNSEAKNKPATKTTRARKPAIKAPVTEKAGHPCGPTETGNGQTAKSAESTKDIKVPDNALRGATVKTRGKPRKVDENADTSEVKRTLCLGTQSPPKTEETQSKSKVQTGGKSEAKKKTAAKATSAKTLEEPQATVREKADDPCDPTATGSDGASKSPEFDKKNNKILQDVLDMLKMKKSAISESAKCVNTIQEHVIDNLKTHLNWCKNLGVLKTGSYYEHVKICEPDEFDVMLTVPVKRVDVQNFSEEGAFYSVTLKRDPETPLKEFLNDDQTIQASKMLQEFRNQVQKALKDITYNVILNRKKKGCPAVTLEIKEEGKQLSIDFVLGLEVKDTSWPDCTKDGFKVKEWLGEKERKKQRKGFYLVPKYEGKGNVTQHGVTTRDVWRISFSHVEKYILQNHGHAKTCCDKGQKCCRKNCLKLLKYLLQQLKQAYPHEADKLCSYHAKTALLHACAARVMDSEWADSKLHHCFQQLLEDFEKNLRSRHLPNFFIPSHNLFRDLSQNKKTCEFLADRIKEERETYLLLKKR